MGCRRKQNGIEVFAALPWPVGVAAGLTGFIGIQYGFAWWMGRQGGPLAQGCYQGVGTMLSPLAWMVLTICWFAAVASFIGSHYRRKLLYTRTNLDSLSQDSWRRRARPNRARVSLCVAPARLRDWSAPGQARRSVNEADQRVEHQQHA